MLLYLYALADALDDVSDLSGLAHETLILAPSANAVAVGGWVEHAPVLDRDNLIAQDRIVRELHTRAQALLPMRFGTTRPDLDALNNALQALGPRLRDQLDLVRGREQMTLRVIAQGEVSPKLTRDAMRGKADAEGPGTRYLAAARAKEMPPELRPLMTALRPMQRASKIERGRHPGVLATVYDLIDRGSSDDYRHAAESAAQHLSALTVRISGPAPAYAFGPVAGGR